MTPSRPLALLIAAVFVSLARFLRFMAGVFEEAALRQPVLLGVLAGLLVLLPVVVAL